MTDEHTHGESPETWLDPDIDAMELDEHEKAGLQVYRNYTASFERHAIKRFVETIDREPFNTDDLARLLNAVANDEARLLPVILCAYADEILKDVFKRLIPENTPGGKSELLGGYGPLSDLSKRVKLAFVFDVLSPDLMAAVDQLRKIRNDISHSWDMEALKHFFLSDRAAQMHRVEDLVLSDEHLNPDRLASIDPLVAFRIRLIWIVGRLAYEGAAYARAKQARLIPATALYGTPATKWLQTVAALCADQTRLLI